MTYDEAKDAVFRYLKEWPYKCDCGRSHIVMVPVSLIDGQIPRPGVNRSSSGPFAVKSDGGIRCVECFGDTFNFDVWTACL
jgi:hypothetical protein